MAESLPAPPAGFYWIKVLAGDHWTIAEYRGGWWTCAADRATFTHSEIFTHHPVAIQPPPEA